MKIKSLIMAALVGFSITACNGDENSKDGDTVMNGDTLATPIAGEATSLCFVRTDGTKNLDTTSVELVIKEDKVSGQMYWHPFEKDSRRGALSGTIKGDTVNAVWTFMQEGMQDTMALQFLVKGNSLMQKPLIVNTKTGRQQTDSNAAFTIAYTPSVDLKKR